MYDWVETWNAVGGKCPHRCRYCYVDALKKRFPKMIEKYSGEARIIESELKPLGKGKTIFVSSCMDLFADTIPREVIIKVLHHCKKYPDNIYLLQSKNPNKFFHYYTFYKEYFPPNFMFATTIETNRDELVKSISNAPSPTSRYFYMMNDFPRKVVTIEPIMDFDLDELVRWMEDIQPEFVNVGADSKGNNLPEPPAWKVRELIKELSNFTEVKIKKNLRRILEELNERKNN